MSEKMIILEERRWKSQNEKKLDIIMNNMREKHKVTIVVTPLGEKMLNDWNRHRPANIRFE